MNSSKDISLLDQFMPVYQTRARYCIDIQAPVGEVFQTMLRSSNITNSRIFHTLLKFREIPSVLCGAREEIFPKKDLSFSEMMRKSRFCHLGIAENKEVVFGIIGKFWNVFHTDLVKLDSPEQFKVFQRSGYGKAAMNVYLEPIAEGTRLSTETRVYFAEGIYLMCFEIYWLIIAPFSGLIRKIFIKNIKEEVEAYGTGTEH